MAIISEAVLCKVRSRYGIAARVFKKAASVSEIGGNAMGAKAAIVLGDLRPMGAIAPICNPAISMAVRTAADEE